MKLYLSDMNKSFEDLFKAGRTGGGPRTGGGGPRTGAASPVTSVPGPKTGSGGGPRTGTGGGGMKMPKTPGAVSGGGKQIVDCPLGAECPDGGRHEMGGARYREHAQLAMKQKQSGMKQNDESTGQATEKPGVQPGSQNIGSLGSDQVKKPETPPAPSGFAGQGGEYEETLKEWRDWEELYDSPQPPLHEHLRDYHNLKPDEAKQLAAKFKADNKEEAAIEAREKKFSEEGAARESAKQQAHREANPKGYKSALKEQRKQAKRIAGERRRAEGREPKQAAKTEEMPSIGEEATQEMEAVRTPAPVGAEAKRARPGEGELPDTADTLVNMPVSAEVDATGENPAENRKTIRMQAVGKDPNKKRQDVPNPLDPSTAPINSKPIDHYRLAQVARSSGDEKGAKAQEELAKKRAAGLSSEDHKALADQLRKEGLDSHAEFHENVHARVNGGAEKPKAVDPKHDKKIKAVHKEQEKKASKDLSDAKKKHEETAAKAKELADKAKASGKKPAAKKKEEPELKAPSSDHEKLKHENHTSRAKRTADMIESHLKNNKTLSPEDRRRLERAHKMAVYHSKIGYTPTAAHRSELGEVERTTKELGIKENWEDIKAREDAQATAAAAREEAAEQKRAAAAQAREQKPAPKTPVSPLEHAKVADHKSRAKKLREKLESHKNNPNMSEEDHALVDQLIQELGDHEGIEHVPDSELDAKLKEIHKLAGDMGKKPYSPEEAGGEEEAPTGGGSGPSLHRRDVAGYIMSQFHTGRAAGAGMAASATSPYGAAGHLAPQIAGYGLHGATSAGHRLLQRTEDGHIAQKKLDKQKEAQAKEAAKQEKQAKQADKPEQRGLAGGKS